VTAPEAPARSGLLSRLADALARASARWVPDAFSIACVLTFVTIAFALTVGGASPRDCLRAWGAGFWSLLGFGMQMCVVIFAGYLLAISPPVHRLLDALAGVPRSPRQAVAWTAFLSLVLCWLNWGMGLIASAVLVGTVARRHPDVDYRLLVAVAYLGMGATFHGGLSASVPLLVATPDSDTLKAGLIDAPIPLRETVFTPQNLALMAAVILGLPLFVALLHPAADRVVKADPAALQAVAPARVTARPEGPTPAERLMHSGIVNRATALLGLGYLGLEAWGGRLSLTLDTVNLMFLSLAIALHPSPAAIMAAAEDAARPLHGVVLQFPLYAGIAGIIKGTGLASWLASAFLSVATAKTFPLIVFWYSAALDYFVSSGGGKWIIESVYVLKAGEALGVPVTRTVMAYAYGDMATNIVQPFWAIPLLGVARLEFRDILGYEILVFVVYAALMSAVLLAFGS
jgi:short-chain fatty acids transporter